MKNHIIRYGFITLLVIGCYDNNVMNPIVDNTLDLGTNSKSTRIRTQKINTTDGNASVLLEVTPGALYSLQLTDITGKVVAVEGFKAEKVNSVIDLDYTKIPNGSYDLNLLDISGEMVKIPVFINRQ